jgi:hypothetical protein
MKKYLSLLLLSLGLMLWPGASCNQARLEPGGFYAPGATNSAGVFVPNTQPDLVFYQVDAAYDFASYTMIAAFSFEKENRAALWKINPNIKHTLDQLRPQFVEYARQYLKARDAYKSMPVPANLTVMQQVLAKVQQLAAVANTVIPKAS